MSERCPLYPRKRTSEGGTNVLDGPGWREAAAKLLTKGEAWRIAANIAKLPELLGK